MRSGPRELLRRVLRHGRSASGSQRGTDLPTLLYWVLEGDGGRQPRYPFGVPHLDFYRRCLHFGQRGAERRIVQRAAEVLEPVRERVFGLAAAAQRS